MSVDVGQVRAECQAGPETTDEQLEALLEATIDLLIGHCGATDDLGVPIVPPMIPASVWDRATLVAAAEMHNIASAPNGVLNQQWADGDGVVTHVPVRIGRDCLKPAYPLLAPWISGEFFCA